MAMMHTVHWTEWRANDTIVDYCIASLEHRLSLPDAGGKHSFLMVNKLIELECASYESTLLSPNLSTMNISNTNVGNEVLDWSTQSRDDVVGEAALDLTVPAARIEDGVIDLTVSGQRKIFSRECLTKLPRMLL